MFVVIDWNSWIDPHFGPVGITVTALVTAWILYRVARATPTRVARTRQAVESRPDGRVRFHRQFIARQWMLCAVALLPLLTDRGVDAADYGLRYPGSSQTGLALFAFVAAVLLFWGRNQAFAARVRVGRPVRVPAARVQQRLSYLAPRTGLDRLWGVGTALTAGICEEIVFRGLLYGAAITLLGLDPWFAALISATLFGLAHRYQGPAGVIGTGLLGLALTALYATSGSLLLPIALHVALDIAAFVLPTTIVEPTPDPAPPAAPQPPIDRAAPGIRLRSAAPDSTTPA